MVGLLGRVISSSQGLYLHRTTQHRKARDKHSCLERDSNPRSQQPTGQDPCLRPHGHCDRHFSIINIEKGPDEEQAILLISNEVILYIAFQTEGISSKPLNMQNRFIYSPLLRCNIMDEQRSYDSNLAYGTVICHNQYGFHETARSATTKLHVKYVGIYN
jgi:hypothetical protein